MAFCISSGQSKDHVLLTRTKNDRMKGANDGIRSRSDCQPDIDATPRQPPNETRQQVRAPARSAPSAPAGPDADRGLPRGWKRALDNGVGRPASPSAARCSRARTSPRSSERCPAGGRRAPRLAARRGSAKMSYRDRARRPARPSPLNCAARSNELAPPSAPLLLCGHIEKPGNLGHDISCARPTRAECTR